jgi:hypothetical protein
MKPEIDLEKLENTLKSLGLDPRDIAAIWHTLWDYSGDYLDVKDARITR